MLAYPGFGWVITHRHGGFWEEGGSPEAFAWSRCAEVEWIVLRWGREDSASTSVPTEREVASCEPHSTDKGTTTPEGESGPQNGTQGVTLATGDIVHLTEMGGRSIEVTLDWATVRVDTREWCGKSVRLVAEDGDER